MPWLGWTCGACSFFQTEREYLCDFARFTGYDLDGGYAELAVADERYCRRGLPRRGSRRWPSLRRRGPE